MTERPTSIDYEGLMQCARGEMFGPGTAQLPAPPMLMMDRITEISADGGEHGQGHVVAELDAYAKLVTPGCYCIVLDTFVEDMPQGFIKDRPWDKGNNPKTAVHEWLAANPGFAIDHDIESKLMITGAPAGFLKCMHRD